jgi:hypothetical protein
MAGLKTYIVIVRMILNTADISISPMDIVFRHCLRGSLQVQTSTFSYIGKNGLDVLNI